jgi:hypothetical protein
VKADAADAGESVLDAAVELGDAGGDAGAADRLMQLEGGNAGPLAFVGPLTGRLWIQAS